MCLLTFCPHGKTPSRQFLENGCCANPDGFGYAILDYMSGSVLVRKSMSARSLLDKFYADREHLDGPALFHSRWGTAGLKDESNCHPFQLGSDARTYVGHNGVIHQCNPVDMEDPRSDTAIWAASVLPSHNPHTLKGKLAAERYIGKYNKAVIISADFKKYPFGYQILNESEGIWETDACWYSNTGYLPRAEKHYGWIPTANYNTRFTSCAFCEERQVGSLNKCFACDACQYCGDPRDGTCQCPERFTVVPYFERANLCEICEGEGHDWPLCPSIKGWGSDDDEPFDSTEVAHRWRICAVCGEWNVLDGKCVTCKTIAL